MEPKTLNSAKSCRSRNTAEKTGYNLRKGKERKGKEREKLLSSQGCAPERVVVENNALGDKDKKLPILDIRPGRLKPGVVDADGDIQGNGMSKVSISKAPQNYSLLQTRLRDLLSLRVGLAR
ncbi:hypothetical protein [Citrobacter youngae]|uniref:hypothetical protein n=1 Tax=Citrobacter youngae TaxID=133448 RepID=UPI0039B454DD